MINFIKYQKITNWKIVRKKVPILKIVKNLDLLELLDKGFYAQEIAQKYSLSASFLSRIITSFKSRNLIEQIQSYPKKYKCTNLGTLFLEQGDLNQKRIQEFTSDKELLPKGIERIRVHKLRFKNKIVQKPSWLNRIQNEGFIYGLHIKRIELNNWTKFLIFFNYQDFNGLEKIEVCNNVIIYNFNRNIDEQYVSSNKELETYFEDIISDCKQARLFLQKKGFIIDERDPEFCQKPHFAIKSNGDPNALGSLGKQLILTIKTPTEVREVDDSPKTGDGEEETDNIEKVKSYFDMPNALENIKTEVSELKDAMFEMAKGIKEMAKSITSLVKPQEQTIEVKSDPGGSMFR